MPDDRTGEQARAIDDEMAAALARRRHAGPERRLKPRPVESDRRKVCGFCFQPGDHPTPAHCLRALER